MGDIGLSLTQEFLMKNVLKTFEAMRSIAIITLAAVIVFSMASCSDGGGGGGGNNPGGNPNPGTGEESGPSYGSDHYDYDSVSFSRGVAFYEWFEGISSAKEISFTKYSEKEFADAKSLGFDAIRLPIDFYIFTSGAPNYVIDPHLFGFLDKAVDLAEKYRLYIILDNHPRETVGVFPPVNERNMQTTRKIWPQMTEHFKNRSKYVIYEILNEPQIGPGSVSGRDWEIFQGEVIDAIRDIDQNHWIVVSGIHTSLDPAEGLSALPRYTDKKLLYTFHFYEPHIFTIPPESIKVGLPFPYDSNRMPNELRGTGVEDVLRSTGTIEYITSLIEKIADFARERNVPVFCGEFGVYKRYATPEDRVRYHQFLREAFEARNIQWSLWGYFDQYGIFNSQIDSIFSWGDINTDLNVELVRALGLTPPPQRERQKERPRSVFTIYDDYLSRGSYIINVGGQQTIDLYHTPAAEGSYAIHWGNWKDIGYYNSFEINFIPCDLSYLVQNGYVLEFKAKTGNPARFDIKFNNFQDNITWGNGYNIDQRTLPPDGSWHTIRIPLKDFQLWGGFHTITDQFMQPQGDFSWDTITKMEFSSRQEDGSHDIYLDSIRITK